ncbi:MAG TPA: hypothetical protein VJR89_33940 [Polyangiales bacterium]|nr:hypothetical protein [Polyangiales bacterium]
MKFQGLACSLALAACAHATPQASLQPATPPAQPAEAAPLKPAAPSRFLPQTATYADVVDIARALDAADHTRSDAGCLIRVGPPAQLDADVLAGAKPLPEVPIALAAALEKAAGPAAVVSAWGTSPGELPEIALVAFTSTTPRSAKWPAVAVFATAPGKLAPDGSRVFVRGAAQVLRAHPEAMSVEAAGALLAQVPDPAIVYVSAESAVGLEQLVALLRTIPNRFEVALAVALPKATRLPTPAAPSSELACADGLPAPADSDVEGSLDRAQLREVLAPLRDAGLACALSTGGRALLGGRLELGIRIGPDGRPRDVCMVKDAIGEAVLRRCLVSAARSLQFPAPNPAGFVDVQLPIELALEGPAAQRALCE